MVAFAMRRKSQQDSEYAEDSLSDMSDGSAEEAPEDDAEEEEAYEEHWCTLYFPNSRLVCSDRLITYNERSPSWANAAKAGA